MENSPRRWRIHRGGEVGRDLGLRAGAEKEAKSGGGGRSGLSSPES